MNIDTFIKQGEHGICEDYVIAKMINGSPVLVISDGCSSSPNTDVGSKLLALNFIAERMKENDNK